MARQDTTAPSSEANYRPRPIAVSDEERDNGMNGGVSMRCPHCKSRANARTSKTVSTTMREIVYACRNHECGFVWAATLEAVRVLSPSSIPSSDVHLPLSPHINRSGVLKTLADAQLALHMEPP